MSVLSVLTRKFFCHLWSFNCITMHSNSDAPFMPFWLCLEIHFDVFFSTRGNFQFHDFILCNSPTWHLNSILIYQWVSVIAFASSIYWAFINIICETWFLSYFSAMSSGVHSEPELALDGSEMNLGNDYYPKPVPHVGW